MRARFLALAVALLCVLAPAAPAADADAEDRARLLRGIEDVELPGAPGPVVVFGDDAFAVLTGDARRPEAVVAAARAEKGRVVAFGHDGYVAAERLEKADGAGRLLANALRWAARREGRARVGVVGGDARVVAALRAADFDPESAPKLGAGGPDVLLVAAPDAFAPRAEEIAAWVRRGGGLVAGACPWGWEQVRGKSVRTEMPLNRFLATCGLAWADGTPDATEAGRYAVAKSRPDRVHAAEALRAIESGVEGAAASAYVVEKAMRSVPPDDRLFLPRAAAAAAKVPADAFPRPSRPLRASEGLARLAVAWRSIAWRDLAPQDVRAAPGAEEFPGLPDPKASRGPFEISVVPHPPGWQSTGLYAGPGELVTLTVTTAAPDPRATPRWRVRVGCHTDRLWDLDTWSRWPEITHVVPLSSGTTRVATPWGGPLYLEPLEGAQWLRVTVEGAVEAPIFRAADPSAVTGPSAWAQRRRAGAPWAEIVGFHVALSVPSEAVRALHDPGAVAAWWDEVLRSHCELTAEPVPARPERFVCDAQISAGYMHSGYPVMMHLDVGTPSKERPALLVDVERLRREGAWGPFHELGHNRQKPEWTFEGTGEVTCNLFSLHAGEKLCGIAPWTNPWLEGQKANAARYLKAPDFRTWKSDPGIALTTYARIVREFGWEPLRTTLAEYRTWPAGSLPKTDAARIDHFVLRLSAACGRDLRPYFRRWAWPLGPAALADAATSELPAWDPDLRDVGPRGR